MEFELPMSATSCCTPASFFVCPVHELTVVYVSQGFTDMYGLSAAECEGKSNKCLLDNLQVSTENIKGMAQLSELEHSDIERKLRYLACYAAHEQVALIKAGRYDEVGVALLLHGAAGRSAFTCELTTFMLPHPVLGACIVSMQRDVSSTFSVEHLLSIARQGEYIKLVRSHRSKVNTMESTRRLRNQVVPSMIASVDGPWSARKNPAGSGDSSEESDTESSSQKGNIVRLRRVACGKKTWLRGFSTQEPAGQ